jgi:hypothetical protein
MQAVTVVGSEEEETSVEEKEDSDIDCDDNTD